MPSAVYTINLTRSVSFTDATGVSFVMKDSNDNTVETATNVAHYNITSPTSSLVYSLDWVSEPQGGDDANVIEFHYNGLGNYSSLQESVLTCAFCYNGYPQWSTINLPDTNWTTGEDVGVVYGIDLNNAILNNGDIPGTTFTIHPDSVSPNNNGLPANTTLNANGTITGTVGASQGGTYAMVFDADNQYGHEVISQDIELTITLEVTAPTFSTIPDLGNQEVGSTITDINLADYVTYDGDPSNVQTLTYSETGVNLAAIGLSLNATTGVISGTIINNIATHTITVVVTNEALLSDTDAFDIPVVNTGTSETPVVVGWYSGVAGCAVSVAPTWDALSSAYTYEIATSDAGVQSIDLNDHIASNGGVAIDTWAKISGTYKANWSLDTGTGLLTRTANAEVASETPLTFTAENTDNLTSATSPTLTISVIDDTIIIPTITGISATEGSNNVFVNLSEACYTGTGTIASYELDFVFKVNTITRGHTYISGGGTNQLLFTLDGVAFTGNNTITLDFTD